MAYATSSDTRPVVAAKVLIAGGLGAGKTTLVGALSEIDVLSTEETMSAVSVGVDHLTGTEPKTTTTVAMDFGRITLAAHNPVRGAYLVQVMLFGTPGQDRFWFMWDDLVRGAIGGIVLADTRRLEDCFPAVEFFECRRTPFVVAVNAFDNTYRYSVDEIRDALDLAPDVPVLSCDARSRDSGRTVLVELVLHAITRAATPAARS
ncbi:ATP/GTP-binding protein [Streptomyces sp. Go40/10]|uniref:GTP-binding protein n=1 Tax=Streptomyces sp. Go40/10 TaxID=2825844 RepID=UPI001E383D0F|nr:ATP/GTP-binding protein [Streptomyces sp. Go40/10]UFQ99783.1 ATP/GTP-binding protein [Streptomyces sp. Go40/10]